MRSIAAIVFALTAVAIVQGCSSEDDGGDKKSATGGGTGTGGGYSTGSVASSGGAASTGGVASSTGGQATCPTSAAYCPATGSGRACCVGNTCGTDLGMGCVVTVPDAN